MPAAARAKIVPPAALPANPLSLSSYTKLGVLIAKFLANEKVFDLDAAIENYAVLKPEKPCIDKLYRTCIKRFKETGLSTIVGRHWTIEKTVSQRHIFDKDRFIAEHGQETYDKYLTPCDVEEFAVKPTPKTLRRRF